MQRRFSKYQGLGNDFVLVEASLQGSGWSTEAVQTLCDRHLGIGADGILFTWKDDEGIHMQVANADGSRPEMCGNGLRCVARHWLQRDEIGEETFVVLTEAGPHRCRSVGSEIEVEMRRPEVLQREASWGFGNDVVNLTSISMGNPHAVTFDSLGESRLMLGPRIGNDPRFPGGTNVGFATLTSATPGEIDLQVWERGAGWTRACGTGACAAAVAAVASGRCAPGQVIAVRLPGGVLKILVPSLDAPVRMTGPAHLVFEGTLREEV